MIAGQWLVVATFLVAAGAPGSGSAIVDAAALTPEDAVERAFARSGALEAVSLDVEEKAIDRRMRLAPLELQIGHRDVGGVLEKGASASSSSTSALSDLSVALAWKLPTARDLTGQWNTDVLATADAADAEEARRDLKAEVLQLHARARALFAEIELIRTARAIAGDLAAQTRARVAAGTASGIEEHLAELDAIEVAEDAEQLEADAERVEARLAALVGAALPLRLAAPQSDGCEAPAAPVAELAAQAEAKSARLAALVAREERARSEEATSWLSSVPWIDSLRVGTVDPLGGPDASVRARVDIALPVFDLGGDERRRASLQGARYAALARDERARIGADVDAAARRLTKAAELVRMLKRANETTVDGGLARIAGELADGKGDVLRLAEVQARSVRAQRSLVRARWRCEQAAVELLRLVEVRQFLE